MHCRESDQSPRRTAHRHTNETPNSGKGKARPRTMRQRNRHTLCALAALHKCSGRKCSTFSIFFSQQLGRDLTFISCRPAEWSMLERYTQAEGVCVASISVSSQTIARRKVIYTALAYAARCGCRCRVAAVAVVAVLLFWL